MLSELLKTLLSRFAAIALFHEVSVTKTAVRLEISPDSMELL
jgi:hypothetical protein